MLKVFFISLCFFLQATFCGSSIGKRAGYHFNTADFESMGYHLCDTLLDYCDPDDSKVRGRLHRTSPFVHRFPGVSIWGLRQLGRNYRGRHPLKRLIVDQST